MYSTMLCILYETSLHSIYKFISNYIAKQGQNLAGVNYTMREKGNIIKISDNVENGENLVYNKSHLFIFILKMFIIVQTFILIHTFFTTSRQFRRFSLENKFQRYKNCFIISFIKSLVITIATN